MEQAEIKTDQTYYSSDHDRIPTFTKIVIAVGIFVVAYLMTTHHF